ncbi:putative odorant-binding protein A10 [Leptopilina heterotoma]|uniref:putative odorant-binding protein A10 n=1 Tax=Leptopilina heterotoma TaxID=63436 RepID=UPI001CA99B2C|nr:putative odorant-binding protein A10 [Leptopilina heterotoma]
MTLLIKISVMCLAIYAVTAIPLEGQQNKPKISEEDLEIALKDSRYIKKQLTCALENIKCDSVGRRLKSLAPLVLRGSCPQCTQEEATYIRKVLAHVQREYPIEWARLIQKYYKS